MIHTVTLSVPPEHTGRTKSNGRRLTREGYITVPPEVNRSNGEIEARYRAYLWPEVSQGYKRKSRTMKWPNPYTLHYVIVDVRVK